MEDWKKEINERSVQLIDEFKQHWQEVIDKSDAPNRYDKSEVFEGWMIQKIASIQLAIEKINKASGGPYIPGLDFTSNN